MEANELGISQRRPQQQQPRFSTPQQPRTSSSTPQQPRASSSTQQQHQWVPSSIQWSQQTQQLSPVCLYCSDAHLLDGCPKFSELSVPERKQFLFKQRLCLKCFGRNHQIGKCREKVQCLLCNRFGHNTLLHAAPLTSQSPQVPSSSSGMVNVMPAGSNVDVQNRLLQLSGTQVVDPTPAETGAAPLDSQVNVSAAVSTLIVPAGSCC